MPSRNSMMTMKGKEKSHKYYFHQWGSTRSGGVKLSLLRLTIETDFCNYAPAMWRDFIKCRTLWGRYGRIPWRPDAACGLSESSRWLMETFSLSRVSKTIVAERSWFLFWCQNITVSLLLQGQGQWCWRTSQAERICPKSSLSLDRRIDWLNANFESQLTIRHTAP